MKITKYQFKKLLKEALDDAFDDDDNLFSSFDLDSAVINTETGLERFVEKLNMLLSAANKTKQEINKATRVVLLLQNPQDDEKEHSPLSMEEYSSYTADCKILDSMLRDIDFMINKTRSLIKKNTNGGKKQIK